jgi:hypothetical protein
MARPKATDPREHLPLRIRHSARQWWGEQARQKGMDGAPQLVQQVLEERAARRRNSSARPLLFVSRQ